MDWYRPITMVKCKEIRVNGKVVYLLLDACQVAHTIMNNASMITTIRRTTWMLLTRGQVSSSSTTGWLPTIICSKKERKIRCMTVSCKHQLTSTRRCQFQSSGTSTSTSNTIPLILKSRSSSTRKANRSRLFWKVLIRLWTTL